MRSRTQIRPVGNDSATDFSQQQQNRANNELQLFDSEDIGVKHMTRGVRLYLKKKFFPSSQSTSSVAFQGEFDPTRSYSQGQEVKVSLGANAGTYVYVNAAPSAGNLPWVGLGFWVQIAGPTATLWQ